MFESGQNPSLELLPDRRFRVLRPIRWRGKRLATNVYAGFVTDLASIPRVLWSILPPHDSYAPAAIVHDFLYNTQSFSRSAADSTLLEAMKALRVPQWQRWAIYAGVRAGGWYVWNKISKRNKGNKGNRRSKT